MPRKLKPYKIGEVRSHRYGQHTDLLLDRNMDPPVFYAVVGDTRVQAESAAECRRLIQAEFKQQANLKWKQVIVAKTKTDWTYQNRGSVVRLEIERHEIAPVSYTHLTLPTN